MTNGSASPARSQASLHPDDHGHEQMPEPHALKFDELVIREQVQPRLAARRPPTYRSVQRAQQQRADAERASPRELPKSAVFGAAPGLSAAHMVPDGKRAVVAFADSLRTIKRSAADKEIHAFLERCPDFPVDVTKLSAGASDGDGAMYQFGRVKRQVLLVRGKTYVK